MQAKLESITGKQVDMQATLDIMQSTLEIVSAER